MSIYTKTIDLQKLQQAWEHVRKNKPAAGVDNITYEIFDSRKREELKQLNMDLAAHTYQALPVRKVVIYKEEKSRDIALYAMRDKVLQQSLAQELTRIFDGKMSSSTYAYRNNKSALVALDAIEKEIQTGKWKSVLKLDIHHFFDSIRWPILEQKLRRSISEDDVIDLIRQNAATRVLEDTGEIIERNKGIHQGSGIAPILSNIYLLEFDNWLLEKSIFFIRYSDDMLILSETRQQLMDLLTEITCRLEALGLKLNERKTVCHNLTEGVDFLGHSFSEKGKEIPQKAKDNLRERLETMWLTSPLTFQEKLKKATSIIGGWEQYFSEEREIGTIFEFAAMIALEQRNSEHLQRLAEMRKGILNIYKDMTIYLASIWQEYGFPEMELYEYEQLFQLNPAKGSGIREERVRAEALDFYRRCVINETEEIDTELMQLYTDSHQYEKAAVWMERKEKLAKQGFSIQVMPATAEGEEEIIYNGDTAAKIMKLFVGREDIYSLESLGNGGKRQTETQLLPLTEQEIRNHLKGEMTIGTYVQRPNSTVKCIVIDVDVSKKVLLRYNRETQEFKEYLAKAGQICGEILHLYQNWGIQGYVEYSGCRGYHIWLLFTEWIPVRYANMFCELIERKIEADEDISIEFFPNKTRLKPGKYGQCMKLPYGVHSRTGERSYFVEENGMAIWNVNPFLDSMARFQLSAVKKILAANTDFSDAGSRELEFDLSALGEVPASIEVVLGNCTLMKYLCKKVVQTGYLTHFERLSILYVFGHMGEDGRQFIHQVMSMTLNYQYHVTEKFINKIPEKPISCIKLRDQYKSITAEYGCSCSFKRSKNCYPSPVLHAISLSNDMTDKITVPVSRTLTKEKEEKVIAEMNIHKKAEELANRILDMKKQRRKLDGSIRKIENELSDIFDEQKIDCLEIEMGLLVRRRKESGYEWLIEI